MQQRHAQRVYPWRDLGNVRVAEGVQPCSKASAHKNKKRKAWRFKTKKERAPRMYTHQEDLSLASTPCSKRFTDLRHPSGKRGDAARKGDRVGPSSPV